MPIINTVGVISKPNVPAAIALVPRLLEWLHVRGITARLDEASAVYGGGSGIPRADVPEGCDLVIVLGGDGTLLSAVRAIGRREIPMFPVNLGGLGFLTAITVDELFPELERALRGEHRVARRKLLNSEVVRDGKVVASFDALNDAVLTKSDIARMIDLDVYVDDQLVCAYKARAHHLDADGFDGVFAVRRRADYFPVGAGDLPHADLPAYAYQSAGAGAGDKPHSRSLSRAR
jgi:NAD+ kinase